jgi:hypothetical protein
MSWASEGKFIRATVNKFMRNALRMKRRYFGNLRLMNEFEQETVNPDCILGFLQIK